MLNATNFPPSFKYCLTNTATLLRSLPNSQLIPPFVPVQPAFLDDSTVHTGYNAPNGQHKTTGGHVHEQIR